MIAALYVERGGCYWDLPGVDPWDERRDARHYAEPHRVVAHPPCQRWGRFWHGSTRKPHQYELGDDAGCFAAALTVVRRWGGVLEHPAYSHAWGAFGLSWPIRGGWSEADLVGGWTCHVEQAHYGHIARKATWLYAVGCDLPDLRWGPAPQRLNPIAVERYGYAYARRAGVISYLGGKDKSKLRAATPVQFRDLLINLVNDPSSAGTPHGANDLNMQCPIHAPTGNSERGPCRKEMTAETITGF